MTIDGKNIEITVVKTDDGSIRAFCLGIVKEFYGIDYHNDWAYDLDDFQQVENIFHSQQSVFYIVKKEGEIIATAALRPLTSAMELVDQLSEYYGDGKDIGIVTRIFIDKKYRNKGLGTVLSEKIELFARNAGYAYLYLNATRKPDVASFWQKRGYSIFTEEQDAFLTAHMEKQIL